MKIKLKDWFCRNALYVYTFLASLLTICTIFYIKKVAPFGDMSLLCTDFYHQYGPMLGELHDRVLHGQNLLYSFTMGLGLPLFRNFFNYLSSPFHLLLFLFRRENLVTLFSIVIGLKVVASSVAMVYYLSKKFKTTKFSLLPLGVLYAFSAWFIAYFWNIMWLDGMTFLPLVVLGIEKIVDEKKWKLYTGSLSLLMFSNFFISFMVCIFSAIYFVMYGGLAYLEDKRKTKTKWRHYKKIVLTFTLSSLLAASLGAFFLLPMAKSITSISASGDEFPTEQYYKFEPKDYLFSHFSGVDSTVFSSDNLNSPNVSCGILSMALVSLFLLNSKISIKIKVGYSLLLGFFLLAFFVPQLDFILHAFHVPNDLPYRYSFLYSFLLIVMCGYSVVHLEKMKSTGIYVTYLLIMASLYVLLVIDWVGLTDEMVLYNMGMLTAFFILTMVCHFKKKFRIVFALVLLAFACGDVVVSTCRNWELTIETNYLYEKSNQRKEELDYLAQNDEEKFYRVETLSYVTLNDGSWFGYRGASSFSSMVHESMAILQHNLGVPGNEINSFYYTQSTPIYDLMFDIKYLFGTVNDKSRYEDYQYFDGETLSKFHYTVGPIFGVKDTLKRWNFSNPNPLEVQNDFMREATSREGVLHAVDTSMSEAVAEEYGRLIVKYTIENPRDTLYFYSNSDDVEAFIIGNCLYYNDEIYTSEEFQFESLSYYSLSDYASDGEQFVVNIDSVEDTIDLYVVYREYNVQGFELYTIDHEKFVEAYQFLDKYRFDIEHFSESDIEGKIRLDENMMVYTSIPYDEGWKVTIDGREVETMALGNALLAFDCPSGEHEIRLQYHIPLFFEGATISTMSFLGILFYEIYRKKKRLSATD